MKLPIAFLRFCLIYGREVFQGGCRIAWDVLTPGLPTTPGVIEMEVPPMKPFQRLMLAALISMTPGSISIDYNERGDVLHIHLLYREVAEEHLRRTVREHYLPVVLALSPASMS